MLTKHGPSYALNLRRITTKCVTTKPLLGYTSCSRWSHTLRACAFCKSITYMAIMFDMGSTFTWRWHIYVQFQYNNINYIWRSVTSSRTTTKFSPKKPGGGRRVMLHPMDV